MSILIFAVIVVLIVGLCLYGVDLAPIDPRLKTLAKLLLLIIAILMLVERAGLV